jgi:hypothetical protein
MSLKLGELLLGKHIVSEAQLNKALEMQRQIGGKLGNILVKLKYLSEEQLAAFLGEQLKIPVLSLCDLVVNPNVSALVDVEILEKHQILPIRRTNDTALVALADPLDLNGVDKLHFLTGLRIDLASASPTSITKAINYYFHGKPCPEIEEAEKAKGLRPGQGSIRSSELRVAPLAVLQALTELLIERKIISQDELLARVAEKQKS